MVQWLAELTIVLAGQKPVLAIAFSFKVKRLISPLDLDRSPGCCEQPEDLANCVSLDEVMLAKC